MKLFTKLVFSASVVALTGNIHNTYAADQSECSDPELILTEFDPWAMVIGSDSPTFAYYANGNGIYQSFEQNKGWQFKIASVSQRDKSTLASLIANACDEFENSTRWQYTLSHWTDQPTITTEMFCFSKWVTVSAYGDMRKTPEVRKKAPQEFRKLYEHIVSFDPDDAQIWIPTLVEVMIWPYEYAPDESVKWPQNWPDINSPRTIKSGDSYSIFISYERSSDLKKLLSTRKKKGAVEINGRKWAVATRIPFPHENVFCK